MRQTENNWPALYFKGICMGIADLIPGVSGGTIAFIFGIYQQLLDALHSLGRETLPKLLTLQFRTALNQIHIRFLAVLGLGIATSLILFTRLMHYLLLNWSTYTWSFFFGLIAASVPSLSKRVQNPRAWQNVLLLLTGAGGSYWVMGLIPAQTPNALWFIALSGFIGITAMILPGISGSFILLVLGKYQFITGALKNPFEANHLAVIATFCAGAFLSLISISQLLALLYKKYPHRMTAFLTGLLLGSLKKVWPWKEGPHNLLPPMSPEVALAILIMALGVIAILAMDRLGKNARAL